MTFNPNRPIRLSPSGPFIGNPPAMLGPSNAGIVFRANGANVTGPGLSTTTAIPGLSSLAWSLPSGYLYDIEVDGEVAGATAGVVTCAVEVSSDGGLSWVTANPLRMNYAIAGNACFRVHEVAFAPTAAVNLVRVTALADQGQTAPCVNWALRIGQYTT